ncbi:MAG: tRNA (adenosine(37)-N6)-threonylcarbamoyltransferase complex ATPase subunit type 1 TsaE [Simkaniaceae bacterium]|nr:tRNA (adenosine(37)-N6)-threonylcarbamoyltransferase complex ATPase subunit type 1 TsaE [Simkaniaceae bacterium]
MLLFGSKISSHSSQETWSIGCEIGKTLPKGSVLCFYGNLGSGKTTLIQGIVFSLTGISEVPSPTFTYVQAYPNEIYHYDLYRLNQESEFLARGLDEPFGTQAICLIEWPERIPSLLPKHAQEIRISHA